MATGSRGGEPRRGTAARGSGDCSCAGVGAATDAAGSVADAWLDARREAIELLGPAFYLQRWSGADHDVPLQWPALVAGLVETVLEHPGNRGETE